MKFYHDNSVASKDALQDINAETRRWLANFSCFKIFAFNLDGELVHISSNHPVKDKYALLYALQSLLEANREPQEVYIGDKPEHTELE